MSKSEMIKWLQNLKKDIGQSQHQDLWHYAEMLDEVIGTIEVSEDMGEVSDGYHTFNQLYHQRAVLFATIVNQNKDKAWKSWKHEDGKFCFDKRGEWFIVGIDTPEGSYTYHYEQTYWDMFDCEELDRGKHWDGHTEEDVTRLLSLPPVIPTVSEDTISRANLIKSFLADCECESREEAEAATLKLGDMLELIEDAPSVIPKTQMKTQNLNENLNEDCISRQQAIDTVYKAYTRDDAMNEIYALPPVAPSVVPKPKEGEWIPCSERLPETDNTNEINEFDVLLVVRPKKHPERTPQVYIGKLRPVEGDDGSGNFWGVKTASCEWTIWGWSYFREPEVLAWMPLPKPWKGADDDERAIEQVEHDALYEPTYNSEDGSM